MARGRQARRIRGSSAVEYVVVLVLLAVAGIAGFSSFGKALECKMALAIQQLGGAGSLPAQCGGGSGAVAQGDPGGGGGANLPTVAPPCIGGSCAPGPQHCFVAGTLVATSDGPRAIERIAVGDEVLSRDDESGALVAEPVLATFVTPDMPLVEVTVRDDEGRDERLRATPGHPFWTAGGGWRRADELAIGDALLGRDGRALVVSALVARVETATVYNFEVAVTHSYFVGEAGVWVHNAPWTKRNRGKNKGKQRANPKQVPPTIQMIWPDEEFPPSRAGELQNVADWGNRARQDGGLYTVNLWTTPNGLEQLRTHLGYDGSGRTQWQILTDAGVTIRTDTEQQIPPRLRPLFTEGLATHSYAMASDVARYGYLFNEGGIHLDADIGPGGVDLSQPPPETERPDIPIIAPYVRLNGDWTGPAAAAGLDPDDPAHGGQIMQSIYDNRPLTTGNGHLGINTIFMMAPPGQAFFTNLNNQIEQNAGNRYPLVSTAPSTLWNNVTGKTGSVTSVNGKINTNVAASVTGPYPVQQVLNDMNAGTSYQLHDPNFTQMQVVTAGSDSTDTGGNAHGSGSGSQPPPATGGGGCT